jgi:hypothetical protein
MNQSDIEPRSILGITLTNLLQTRWSDPICHVKGLSEAFYCTVVLEFATTRARWRRGGRPRNKLWVALDHQRERGYTAIRNGYGTIRRSICNARLPDLTKVVIYSFYANGRTYIAQYNQRIDDPDILPDFDLMITKTLKFSK